jgi:hypothetical protein
MRAWFARLFRSRAEALAEKAEVEGRFEDAARLYVESGARAEAFRVLMRAAESARHLVDRRAYLTRAYAVARTDELRAQARRALGVLTLTEAEIAPACNDEERARLAEAAQDLEASGAFREAARAYKLLGDREAMERVLMLAGDIEGYEREAGADEAAERHRLRRRNAIESFETLWTSGDRVGALAALEAWVRGHGEDAEAALLLDERRARLVSAGRFEARLEGAAYVVVGRFPVSLGREADVVVRGASVSREHCVIEREDGQLSIRDNGSRNGTQVQGLPLAGRVPLATGQTIGLGADLSLRVEETPGAIVLEVDRGMDRGRRLVLVTETWPTPLGPVRFAGGHAVLEPRAPVRLLGQRVVAAITLAQGDRVEGDGASLEVLR